MLGYREYTVQNSLTMNYKKYDLCFFQMLTVRENRNLLQRPQSAAITFIKNKPVLLIGEKYSLGMKELTNCGPCF